jgi:sigma-B regulation protein RsbU (phosphoserine phosphatase)
MMDNKIQEKIKELENIFESFLDFYKLKSIHLYIYSHNEIKEIYQLGEKNQSQSLKIESKVLDKVHTKLTVLSSTRIKQFKEITRHFNLQVFSVLNVSKSTKYYLGLVFDTKRITSKKKKELIIIRENIEKLMQNYQMAKELNAYSKRLEQVLNEMGALHDVSRAIESSDNLDTLLTYILKKAKLLMNVESASMMLVVEGTNELEFKVVLGPKSKGVKPFRLPIGQGISGWVAQHGEPILIPDVYADPRFDPSFDKRSGYRTRSMLCVPLMYESKVVGVMTVLNRLDMEPFTESDKTLLMTFAAQAALSIENAKLLMAALEKERLDQELRMASEIQNLLLPREIPQRDKLDIDATYIPCKEMSGDFYDIIVLDENRTVFVVADVSGKGIPGAMVVSNMQASLKAYLKYSSNLIELVTHLNEAIILNTTSDRYITFFIGLYDKRDNTFQYVNAGHNPPLLIRSNDELKELNVGGIFIGSLPWEYETDTVMLEKDDLLTLYTDGLVEAMNGDEEEFEKERLTEVLKINKKNSSKEILKLIISAVKKFAGATDFEDDFTVMVIKRV